MLFSKAQKVIMMSATILDFGTFLRNLGIRRGDAVCLSLPSDFPVQNRRVLYRPVANMGSRTIEQALPLVAAEVERIMRKHASEKGIVHAHTYRIARFLAEHLRRAGMGGRVLTHEEGAAGEREGVVQRHIESQSPTVIISPSMTEGLDLKDDLSRFSVVPKVPYPYLSAYVRARMARDPDWYAWCTALAIQQATGRSNRTREDWATHYVLDSGFGDFVNRHGGMFSPWWAESVSFPGDYEVDW
jgi:Rad3-related DNA helicase